MEMTAIINQLRERGFMQGVQRWKYDVQVADVLEVVQTIGREMNPAFAIDDENRWAYTQLVRWLIGDRAMQAQDPDTGKIVAGRLNAGIYLAGRTGSGKSWALNILQMLARIYDIKVELGGVLRCVYWKAARADQICEEYAKTGDVRQWKNAGTLCVQDLGAEPGETIYMGNRLQPVRQIIEHRGDDGAMLTLFSSNYPLGHRMLVERYGDRVASRLREMCNYIELNGRDRRRPNNNNN